MQNSLTKKTYRLIAVANSNENASFIHGIGKNQPKYTFIVIYVTIVLKISKEQNVLTYFSWYLIKFIT